MSPPPENSNPRAKPFESSSTVKSTDPINHQRSNRLSWPLTGRLECSSRIPPAHRAAPCRVANLLAANAPWRGLAQSASLARGPETRRRPRCRLARRRPSRRSRDGRDLRDAGSPVCMTAPALPHPSSTHQRLLPDRLPSSQLLVSLGARRPSLAASTAPCLPGHPLPPPPSTMEPVACPIGGGPAFVAVGLSTATAASSTASSFHGTRTRLVPVTAAAAAGRRVSALPGALPRRAAPRRASGVAGLRADADYYSTLGVSRSASQEEIKKSFRKLARKYHPVRVSGRVRGRGVIAAAVRVTRVDRQLGMGISFG